MVGILEWLGLQRPVAVDLSGDARAEVEMVDYLTDLDALVDEADYFAGGIPVGDRWS